MGLGAMFLLPAELKRQKQYTLVTTLLNDAKVAISLERAKELRGGNGRHDPQGTLPSVHDLYGSVQRGRSQGRPWSITTRGAGLQRYSLRVCIGILGKAFRERLLKALQRGVRRHLPSDGTERYRGSCTVLPNPSSRWNPFSKPFPTLFSESLDDG